MTHIEQLNDMFKRQKHYDTVLGEAKGIDVYSPDLLENRFMALIAEAGELAQELKGDWCYWKIHQKPVDWDKVLEEWVDVIHFILSLALGQGSDAVCSFITLFELAVATQPPRQAELAELPFAPWGEFVWNYSRELGFTFDQVYEAYCKKNDENLDRIRRGY